MARGARGRYPARDASVLDSLSRALANGHPKSAGSSTKRAIIEPWSDNLVHLSEGRGVRGATGCARHA